MTEQDFREILEVSPGNQKARRSFAEWLEAEGRGVEARAQRWQVEKNQWTDWMWIGIRRGRCQALDHIKLEWDVWCCLQDGELQPETDHSWPLRVYPSVEAADRDLAVALQRLGMV